MADDVRKTVTSALSSADKKGRALVFELEGVAFPVRASLYALFEKEAAALGAKVGRAVFARCGYSTVPEAIVASLALQMKLTESARKKLTETLRVHLAQTLAAEKTAPAKGVVELLKKASADGIRLAAITALPEEPAQAALARLAGGALTIALATVEKADKYYPGPDVWAKAVKAAGSTPRSAAALATSSVSCKSAIAIGLRSAALPDDFTSCQDFSGADRVLEALADLDLGDLYA